MAVKTAVNKELENKRAEKVLGSSLSAEVVLYCDEELTGLLTKLASELRFAFIVSNVFILPVDEAGATAVETGISGLKVKVAASGHSKCTRCWHHSEDIGADIAHPEICSRCVENIAGVGENRQFV